MTITTDGILDVLGAHGIRPLEASVGATSPRSPMLNCPESARFKTVRLSIPPRSPRCSALRNRVLRILSLSITVIHAFVAGRKRLSESSIIPRANRVPRARGEAPEASLCMVLPHSLLWPRMGHIHSGGLYSESRDRYRVVHTLAVCKSGTSGDSKAVAAQRLLRLLSA